MEAYSEKKIFFASDFHLGLDAQTTSLEREVLLTEWLDSIKVETKQLYLLGDIFDYWFEYKEVIPKGHIRFLAKLAEFTDSGIPVHVFTGNHDMWMFDYLEKEIGVNIHRQALEKKIDGKLFLLGHGDGLGPADYGYKFIKKVFRNKINQWLFARLHPNLGLRLMIKFSQTSRDSQTEEKKFLGAEKEWLVLYAERKLKSKAYDYFIFGHRHLMIDHLLSNGSARYLNCGDWLSYNSYVVWDGQELKLKTYQK